MIVCPSCRNEDDIVGCSIQDYVQFWECRQCGTTWNRWAPDDPRYAHAERYRRRYDRGDV